MKLSELLSAYNRIVVLTGAGMSTESGIPDYRGKGGLEDNVDLLRSCSIGGLKKCPEVFREFYVRRMKEAEFNYPNEGHIILANWIKKGRIQAILTQNIDKYHREASLSIANIDANIVELHGSLAKGYCTKCNKVYNGYKTMMKNDLKCYNQDFTFDKQFHVCDGIIKPDITLFDEKVRYEFVQGTNLVRQCDLLLILGSSMKVKPANQLPYVAKENGAKIVVVNHEPTMIDELADLIINDRSITEVLKEAHESLY